MSNSCCQQQIRIKNGGCLSGALSCCCYLMNSELPHSLICCVKTTTARIKRPRDVACNSQAKFYSTCELCAGLFGPFGPKRTWKQELKKNTSKQSRLMTAVEYQTSKSEQEPLNSIPRQSYKSILIFWNKVLPPQDFAGEPESSSLRHSFGELKFPSSQAVLRYRTAIATFTKRTSRNWGPRFFCR